MKWKKWLIILGIVLVIAGACIGYKVMRGYWKWSVPRSLLERIDFDRLIENTDAMLADGYEDATEWSGRNPAIYTVLIKKVSPNINVGVFLIKDAYYSELWSGIRCEGGTWYHQTQKMYQSGDSFIQIDVPPYMSWVDVHSDMGHIDINIDAEHPLDGRRWTIDFLNDFCDRYCAPSGDS